MTKVELVAKVKQHQRIENTRHSGGRGADDGTGGDACRLAGRHGVGEGAQQDGGSVTCLRTSD